MILTKRLMKLVKLLGRDDASRLKSKRLELRLLLKKREECVKLLENAKTVRDNMLLIYNRMVDGHARVTTNIYSTLTTDAESKPNNYDNEITANEVIDALIDLKSFKSIGSDYIPIESLKCALATNTKRDKINDLDKRKFNYVYQHFNKDNILMDVDKKCNVNGVKNRHNRYAKQFRSTLPENTNMLQCIVTLFNMILTTGVMPSEWSISYITMLYKKGDKVDPSNYRPITLMPNLQKIFHKIIASRIIKDDIGVISSEQCAYLPQRSREEHIASLLDYYHTRNIDAKTPVYSSFIDLKAAFDSLDHNLLMKFIEHKLKLNQDSKLLSYLKTSYQNMNYSVRQDGVFSSCRKQTVGTKQGCTLSPLLFIIFFNLIVEELKAVAGSNSNRQLDRKFIDDALILVYADDLCINTQTNVYSTP